MPENTDRAALLSRMFAALDRGDVEAYLAFLTEDASLRFGNNGPVVGRPAIRNSLAAFYNTFRWVRHDHVATWSEGRGAVVEAEVTYQRLDGSRVRVPAVTICRFTSTDAIKDYRVFVDLAPLRGAGLSGR